MKYLFSFFLLLLSFTAMSEDISLIKHDYRTNRRTIPFSINYSTQPIGISNTIASKSISLNVILDSDTTDKKIESLSNNFSSIKLIKKGISYSSDINMNKNDVYEDCVFTNMTLYMNDNCTLRNCDLVNTIIINLNPRGIYNCTITNNKFIGYNSRMHTHGIFDTEISYNQFLKSDSRYPLAIPKTKGEFSRNITAYIMARSKVIANTIEIGRTGILIFGGENKIHTNDVFDEYSSCDNVISGNYVAGIGEEHISFDGSGALFDIGQITNTSVQYVEVRTGQMINGPSEDTEQTKIVAEVTLSLSSQLVGTTDYADTKHIKAYPALVKGFYGVGLKNSKNYKVTNITLTGDTAFDSADGMAYSCAGTYNLTIEVPTIYNYKRTMTAQNEVDVTTELLSDWGVDDFIYVGAIQSNNVISNNIIEGIGTDRMNDVDDMGGIVLYGVCLNNIVSNNILHQKRIWLQQWNNSGTIFKSKIKMQSFNVISNNILIDSSISLVNYYISGFNNDMVLNRGNVLSSNVVSGTHNVAGIVVQKQENITLIGNNSRLYRLKDNDNLKLIGNSKQTNNRSYFTNNTNVKADLTDDIQL